MQSARILWYTVYSLWAISGEKAPDLEAIRGGVNMQYGYFDNEKREYVITDPRTPMPWANYLGSPEYGAIVTQNAGGYSFVKSGAAGRILRYTFNQFDEPGRYIYLRDEKTGDFWSASWRPVEKLLEQYKTVTRHGTAYTQIESAYDGIETKALYYVPLNATHEVWRLQVKNTTAEARRRDCR